ncbi:MAG: DUF5106 domain-containing protein [Bacteroidales bacterium]|nr:DUF5106 domain-containing protein [Bacteroidales bacterium]
MMKNVFVFLVAALFLLPTASAQSYKITLKPQKAKDTKYFMGQHFRDKYVIIDSTTVTSAGTIVFAGTKKLPVGVYTLLDSKQKRLFDFMVDDSRKFDIAFDTNCKSANMKVSGSKSNQLMFEYMATLEQARADSRKLNEKMKDKDTAVSKAAKAEMEALGDRMEKYQKDYMTTNAKYRFTQLLKLSDNGDVPDEIPQDKKYIYYRTHYWDGADLKDPSLIYTPHLFDKMNYYFFGILYSQPCDTIIRYADMILHRVENDSTMLRYFLEFIVPKYEKGTKHIGWDQVFVHLVEEYYLKGKCKWATQAEVYNKAQTIQYLSASLIGAFGQELQMADTAQSADPKDWISSHYFPEKYVILWIWDPDCSHCQKQTAELKTLYDSLQATGKPMPFEVYAVGYESDVKKWKNYIIKHELPFVNVGGMNVNIDYQAAYNVHGAPTMIILNADREIIMNKTLPTSSIIPFIQQYEKDHPEQANRPPSKWQRQQLNDRRKMQ